MLEMLSSFLRSLRRDIVWVFANAFAFLPASRQVIEPGARPLLASVRQLVRVLGIFLGAVAVVVLMYRLAMQRTGREPVAEILRFFPERPLFYLNVGFLVVVFCLACWLSLRLATLGSSTHVGLAGVLQAFVRALGAVLGLQLLLLLPPHLAVLGYIILVPGSIAALNPVLDALSVFDAFVLLLSFALVFLSTLALLARAAGASFLRAGLAVFAAAAVTWALAHLADPYYQYLVALGQRPR